MIASQASSAKNANELALATIIASLGEPEEEMLSLLASTGAPRLERFTLIQASAIELSLAETAVNQLQETGLYQGSNPDVGMHPVHKTITRQMLPLNATQRSRLAEAIANNMIAYQGSPDKVRSQPGNLLVSLDYRLQAGKVDLAALAARLAAPQLVLSGKWDLWHETFERISLAAQLNGDKRSSAGHSTS